MHEDNARDTGIRLPENHFNTTQEDYSDWHCQLCYSEPEDPMKVRMYPKSLVYAERNIEYSPEEIRARRYLMRPPNSLDVPHSEMQQAIQSILVPDAMQQQPEQQIIYNEGLISEPIIIFDDGDIQEQIYETREQTINNSASDDFETPYSNQNHYVQLNSDNNLWETNTAPYVSVQVTQPTTQVVQVTEEYENFMNKIWTPTKQVPHTLQAPMSSFNSNSKFTIYEESNLDLVEHAQPKGAAMKTPFKVLCSEDLAETGSRGGLEFAAAAQPIDSAANLIILDDEDSNSVERNVVPIPGVSFSNVNSPNTQLFNFNLNAMKVSTPQPSKNKINEQDVEQNSTKRQLFGRHNNGLSIICEETKNSGCVCKNILIIIKMIFYLSSNLIL